MAYIKQTWVNGDVITDDKLNHMEDGIAGAGGATPLIVQYGEIVGGVQYLDTIYGDIVEAFEEGRPVIYKESDESDPNYMTYTQEMLWQVLDTKHNGAWNGTLDFNQSSFVVGGVAGETPSTKEELYALYPHIYSD